MRARAKLAALAGGLLLAHPFPTEARAQPAPAPAEDPQKAEAARHFERGLALFDQSLWDPALAEFTRSIELFPTRAATRNAALCLTKLGRADEAVERFEQLVAFPNVSQDDKDLAGQQLRVLLASLGAIEVRAAEPGATIIIDGRQRGTTGAAKPMRVGLGTHAVRVYKEGFEAFEQRVEVASGQAKVVEARLVRLSLVGRLRVNEQAGRALDVVLDGLVVGKTPWEGAVAPGEHSVILRGEGALGTQPVTLPVAGNQTTPITLQAEELSATLRIEPSPAGAQVAIDGVQVGRGLWEGRLRAGAHRVEVGAEGFVAQLSQVELHAGKRDVARVVLERDPDSPLWGRKPARFAVDARVAFAFAPSLGGDIAGCASPCSAAPGVGLEAMGRGLYELRSGFGFGLEAGYLILVEGVSKRPAALAAAGLTDKGTASDSLALHGALAGATAGFHFATRFPVDLRLGSGVLLGALVDRRTGELSTQARAGHPATSYDVPQVSERPLAAYWYVAPEVRVGLGVGKHVELSLGLEPRLLVAVSQPTWTPSEKPVAAHGDGQGTFGAQALAGRVILTGALGAGVRYAF